MQIYLLIFRSYAWRTGVQLINRVSSIIRFTIPSASLLHPFSVLISIARLPGGKLGQASVTRPEPTLVNCQCLCLQLWPKERKLSCNHVEWESEFAWKWKKTEHWADKSSRCLMFCLNELPDYSPRCTDTETNWAWIKQSINVLHCFFTLKTSKTRHFAIWFEKCLVLTHVGILLTLFKYSTCPQFP